MKNKHCPTCHKEKLVEEFSKNRAKKDGLQVSCKDCIKIRNNEWYQKNSDTQKLRIKVSKEKIQKSKLQFISDFLSTHPCVDCGEDNILCLEFDHLSNKKYNVSEMRNLSLSNIEKEIEKCEVRCSNCHSIKTSKERNSYKWQNSSIGRTAQS